MQHHFTRLIRLRTAFGLYFSENVAFHSAFVSIAAIVASRESLREENTLYVIMQFDNFIFCLFGHTDNWTDVAIISLTAKLSNTRVAVMAVVGKCEMKSISPLDALNLHDDRHQVELRKRRLNFSRPRAEFHHPNCHFVNRSRSTLGSHGRTFELVKWQVHFWKAPMSLRCLQS